MHEQPREEIVTKHQVEEFFTKTADKWADFYNDPNPPTLQEQNLVSRMRFALEMLQARVAPGSKVLDVGCGAGQLAGELMRRGYEAWGMDISEAMVAFARQQYHRDRFQAGDIERMDYADNTFDAVTCLGVLEYLSRDEPALREMWRILKPGGWAVITTPSAICPFYYMDAAYEKFRFTVRPVIRFVRYPLLGRPEPPLNGLPRVVHRRYYRPRWLNLLRSLHLEADDWACHCWGWYTMERFFDQGGLCRASDRFARNPWINWLASDQLVCVRAVK
jgi:ubiquinone/menaquinone biosynthesis C-methylase UbiE